MVELKDKERKPSPNLRVKVLSDAMVSIKVSMPMKQWVEWDAECKNSFGDVRWMKMWHDHKVSCERLVIDELFERLGEVTQKEKEKVEEVVKEKLGTFSDNETEKGG